MRREKPDEKKDPDTDENTHENDTHETGEVFVNKWIDVKDEVNNWCEAQVIDINTSENKILVHYKGWKSKFDEWISVSYTERICKINTKTPGGKRCQNLELRVNLKCDVKDTQEKWCPAEIVDIDTGHQQVKAHYTGWSERYDEWLDFDSYRIAPIYRHTPMPESEAQRLKLKHKSSSKFSATSSNEETFRRMLKAERNFEIIEMDNDGSCLFRAMSHQIYGTAEHHALVREKCVDYVESESSFFRNYIVGDEEEFQTYCNNMRRQGVWGDNVEVQAMSEIYDRPVEIYAYQTSPMKTYRRPSTQGSKPPIRLSYHFQSHYNSVVDPDKHFNEICRTTPGEIEDKKVQLSALRSRQALDQSIHLSDVEATELEGIRAALAVSRQEFENQRSVDFDEAVYESIQLFKKEQQDRLNRDIKRAKEVSLIEFAGKKGFDPSDPMSDSCDGLKRAQTASLKDFMMKWPRAVRHCHKTLGFELDLCVEAYSIFGNQPNIPEEVVISNMTNYIVSQKPRDISGFGGIS